MKKAISYIRVSSSRQGKSGLGLEAQMNAIYSFCKTEGFEVIGNFQDVDSGGKNDRQGLEDALVIAKEEGATIIVHKLDRLSRDVHYISGLMKHGVPFIGAELGKDVPSFMLHVYASFAELERTMIRKRTKDALAVAKARGVKLGTSIPKVREVCRESRIAKGNESYESIVPHIKEAQHEGFTSTRKIASFLNDKGIMTPRGKTWRHTSVSRVLIRMRKQLSLFPNQS
jgi:DNA invertase Pin-like site-specific DNA recombinase